MPPKFDSSPVVAFFKDQETAQQCLRQLRSSGFKNEQIEDVLFVITYSGTTPEWPA